MLLPKLIFEDSHFLHKNIIEDFFCVQKYYQGYYPKLIFIYIKKMRVIILSLSPLVS